MAQLLATVTAIALLGISSINGAYQCPEVPATQNECLANVLACCDGFFRGALSINCTDGAFERSYEVPACVRQKIEDIYSLGSTVGLLKVCSEFYNYQTCLATTWKSCTGARWHVTHGASVTDAQLFATIFAQFNYACGAGMDTFLNEDACMADVIRYNASYLNMCRQEFYNNIGVNPTEQCMHLELLTKCFERPFYEMCGTEAAWWGCEFERTGAQLFLPECAPQCTISQTIG